MSGGGYVIKKFLFISSVISWENPSLGICELYEYTLTRQLTFTVRSDSEY